jgi:MbtH protein
MPLWSGAVGLRAATQKRPLTRLQGGDLVGGEHGVPGVAVGPGRLGSTRRGGLANGSGMSTDESNERFIVVVNDEEQYSIWPLGRDLPGGWRNEGTSGTKEECLAHVEAVWTDMRPRSLREAMEAGSEETTRRATRGPRR